MKEIIKDFFTTSMIYKGITAVVVILLVVFAIKKTKEIDRLHQDLIGKTQEYKQLSDHAAELRVVYFDQVRMNKSLTKDWSDEKIALKGRIKILSNATYLIRERARKEKKSDLVYRGKKLKYVFNEIRFKKGPPIGYVMILDNGKVISKIYNHVIDVKMAVSREEDSGRYHIVSKADFVLRSGHLQRDGVNWFGKEYPLKIVGGEAIIDPTERPQKAKFYLLSPHLNGGIHAGGDPSGAYIKPYIGVSFMGYGKTKNDLKWKFAEFGVGFTDNSDYFDLNFTPALYRPFDKFTTNTYIGPGISVGPRGTGYFLGISIGF